VANSSGDPKQYAEATQRNREPIFAVLERVLPERGLVLEIASGTGEHAAFFAPRLPALTWQPTDRDPQLLDSIAAWRSEAGADNLRAPLLLDVRAPTWPVEHADAIVCINMIHIAPWAACEALLDGAARVLRPDGVLYLYGPYQKAGHHTSPSNQAFDEGLRRRDPAWGVRDVDEVARAATRRGLQLREEIPMPNHNLSVVFRRLPP
jgi:SAM-dependent methyltransferase